MRVWTDPNIDFTMFSHAPVTAYHYVTVPAAEIEKIHVNTYNVRGYAFSTMSPRYAIAPPVLTLCEDLTKLLR